MEHPKVTEIGGEFIIRDSTGIGAKGHVYWTLWQGLWPGRFYVWIIFVEAVWQFCRFWSWWAVFGGKTPNCGRRMTGFSITTILRLTQPSQCSNFFVLFTKFASEHPLSQLGKKCYFRFHLFCILSCPNWLIGKLYFKLKVSKNSLKSYWSNCLFFVLLQSVAVGVNLDTHQTKNMYENG